MTDILRRIRRLAQVQRWAIRTALVLWIFGAVLGLLEHDWANALTCAGAAGMAGIALAASKTRDIAVEVMFDPEAVAAAVRKGRDEGMEGCRL